MTRSASVGPSPSPLRPHGSPHPLGRLATAPGQIHATLGCHRRRAHAPARAFRRRPTRPWPAQAVVQSLRRHRGSPPPVPTASQLTARTARGIVDGPAEGAWGVARPVRPSSPNPTKLHACRTTFSPRGGLQPGSAGRPGRTDLPTLQHSRQAPGQGRRTAQLMCAWCLGHVRSDGLLRVGEAIMDARPGAGKGF